MNKFKNICICLNDAKVYSETFIQAHVDHLDAKVIYVSMLPLRQEEADPNTEGSASIVIGFKKILKKIFFYIENKNKEIKIKKKIRREFIGVILAEYGQVGVAVLETCKKNNIPLVVHFHGFDAYKKDVLKKFEKEYSELFRYAKAIIVVSRDMEKQLLNLGAPAPKLHYNVYGVDVLKFKKCDTFISDQQLFFVGRFVEKKAPYLSILAFKKALESVPNAKLFMAGDGLLLDICKNLINSLKISDSVILLGALPHSKVIDYMQTSRAYVQHSITAGSGDSEGTPNAILEALASGLPIISTKHAGIIDVVVHGETGFLVEEGDIDSMAEYMVELLMNPALASKMGENAYISAVNNYTLTDSISKLESILINNMDS